MSDQRSLLVSGPADFWHPTRCGLLDGSGAHEAEGDAAESRRLVVSFPFHPSRFREAVFVCVLSTAALLAPVFVSPANAGGSSCYPGFMLSGRWGNENPPEYHHYVTFNAWDHPEWYRGWTVSGPPRSSPSLKGWVAPSGNSGYAEAGYRYASDWPDVLHRPSDFTLCGYT